MATGEADELRERDLRQGKIRWFESILEDQELEIIVSVGRVKDSW